MSAAIAPGERTIQHELVGAPGTPVTIVLGGISATRHVLSGPHDASPGWWDGIGGEGRALDAARRRVLGVDFLDGGERGDGTPARLVTTHDQAAAIADLLDGLEIDRVDAVIGASYGGMVALALAERWPKRVRRLIVISAAHEAHPMATALRTIQRATVELALRHGSATEGMIIARALAMTTYRSARELAERFPPATAIRIDASGRPTFAVDSYLRHAGEKFAARTTPARFLALSLSADVHRVDPQQVRVPTTLIAAQGDTLVPSSQMRALARELPNLTGYHVLRSRRGHDAFLTDTGRLSRILTSILDD